MKTISKCVISLLALASAAVNAQSLRLGLLPAADSIVLYVAQEENLFKEQGLDVELIPFKSALEVGAAMRAGKIDGHFADLMNVFMQNEQGMKQAVVLTTTHTSPKQRCFGLVVSPKEAEKITSLADLKKTPSAMSSATIIDYLLDRMKDTEKLNAQAIKNLEVKQIPIRLQMLQSGQVATAMLPEPLVSVVEAKGGRVIWDDSMLNEALAVVALREGFLDENTVSSFRKAVAAAAQRIDKDPAHYRSVMVQKRLLPPPVAQTYKMVSFSVHGTTDGLPPLPTQKEVEQVGKWMLHKGMIKSVPSYESIVFQ